MHANLNFERNEWRVAPDETVQVLDPHTKRLQELYLNKASLKTNWKSALVAILVICAVLLGVLAAVLTLGPIDEAAIWLRIPVTLHEILEEGEAARVEDVYPDGWAGTHDGIAGVWLPGDKLAYLDNHGGVSLLDASEGTNIPLVPNSTLRQLYTRDFQPSADAKFVLFRNELSAVQDRYGIVARYSVYDVQENYHFPIRIHTDEVQPTLLQYAGWAGSSHTIVLVYNNDIYLLPDLTQNIIERVTDTGLPGIIFNGIPDFTYAEGSLQAKQMLWPNPSGSLIAYAAINNSLLNEGHYVWYEMKGSDLLAFPQALRYTKAGGFLPEITLYIQNVTNREAAARIVIQPPFGSKDFLLAAVQWDGDTSLLVAWMSRTQNHTITYHCCSPSYKCEEVYMQQAINHHWLSAPRLLASTKDKGSILYANELADEHGDISLQLIHVRGKNHRATPLYHDGVSVSEILAWNEDSHEVFFMGFPLANPAQKHIYVVADAVPPFATERNSSTSGSRKSFECLTCNLGVEQFCQYSRAEFSETTHYFMLHCQGPNVPTHYLWSRRKNEPILSLRGNVVLRNKLMGQLTPRMRSFDFELPDGSTGHVRLYLPLSWKDTVHERNHFPLVVEIADFDQMPAVTERWTRDWGTYLVLSHHFIYARMEGRERRHKKGSLFLAMEDHLHIIDALKTKLWYIDDTRIAVWGKGFGGYVAAAIREDSRNEWVSCSIAVAPITDWSLHESTLSERYIGLPSEHYQDYVTGNLARSVQKIQNDSLLLIHPSPLDPMRQIQSIKLVKALTRAGIRFQQQLYPHADYKLLNVQQHMYHTMENFLERCFRVTPVPSNF